MINNSFGYPPTNTVNVSGFDILTKDSVEDSAMNLNKLATIDLEESYTQLACEFLKEQSRDYSNAKIGLYKSISESSNYGVVLESFTDFFSIVKDIINKFLQFMKSLFKRFINRIMQLVSSDKYIKKNKKEFSKFSSDDEFEFNGYKYTFAPNIPVARAILSYDNDLFKDLYGTTTDLSVDSIKGIVNNLDFDSFYDKFRADVLGSNDKIISLSDFSEECFKVFRDDELETDSMDIGPSEVNDALRRFLNYKEMKKKVESDQKAIEKSYNQVKTEVEEIIKLNGNRDLGVFLNKMPKDNSISKVNGHNVSNNQDDNMGVIMTSDFMAQLDIYIKAKADQIQECSNIHVLAYSAKLDAMKECFIQDRNLLYTALSRILKNHKDGNY